MTTSRWERVGLVTLLTVTAVLYLWHLSINGYGNDFYAAAAQAGAQRGGPGHPPGFRGAFNGLILPIGFTVVVWVAWMRRDLMGGYRYPLWLKVVGVAVWLLTCTSGACR